MLNGVRVSEDMLHRNISCLARMCRRSLSDDDVDRCGHRERGQDNTQAAYTAPRVNMWDNPIKRRPQLGAATMTANRAGDKALRMRRDHLNLL